MTTTSARPSVGSAPTGPPRVRLEARDKVTGTATYAYEYPADDAAYAWVVGAEVTVGRVVAVAVEKALDVPGVLAVLWHGNAPELGDAGDPTLAVLQSPDVAYRGQLVAVVVAETAELAREAARTLEVEYDEQPFDSVLTASHPSLYQPEKVNPSFDTDTTAGDADAGFAASAVQVDATYSTSALHNNAMEPHATVAAWDDQGALTVFDSNQGGAPVVKALSTLFGVGASEVRVVNRHVGGGFGSKGTPRPNVVLAAMAAKVAGRPVKLALTRQQMFAVVGYRTPTIQRVRLGASASGELRSITHEVVEQTGTLKEFAEQTAVATRHMYAAPDRRTTHRLARLDVPVPSWMRAPGECPGMFALESAMDELALAVGIDPVELRILNEPSEDPEEGVPFSSRNLVACLREGARRFGWAGRDPRPGVRREGRWLVGTGVAAATYPAMVQPSTASVHVSPAGEYAVSINAVDIGTGGRTALHQVACEALSAEPSSVTIHIGDSRLPEAGIAGGSMGTTSWGWAVDKACRQLVAARDRVGSGSVPADGLTETAGTSDDIKAMETFSRHAFGAQFAEVHVDAVSGEVRLPRLTGVFAAGRIVNARTARSQFIGGMTMGASMALFEEGVMDGTFGDYANHDLASYHVAACADVQEIDVSWIEEEDPHLGPLGTKGIGEIGIVGMAAAVANAVHHATGVRVRDLPIQVEDLLGALP